MSTKNLYLADEAAAQLVELVKRMHGGIIDQAARVETRRAQGRGSEAEEALLARLVERQRRTFAALRQTLGVLKADRVEHDRALRPDLRTLGLDSTRPGSLGSRDRAWPGS